MARLLDIYKNKGSVSIAWGKLGSYLYMGINNLTFCMFVARWGISMNGTQKEALIRAQVAIDPEPRYSWLTFEVFNFFEARVFYLIFTIWPDHHLKLVFNVGVRLSKESREYLTRRNLENERVRLMQAKREADRVSKGMKKQEIKIVGRG